MRQNPVLAAPGRLPERETRSEEGLKDHHKAQDNCGDDGNTLLNTHWLLRMVTIPNTAR
jgi:hypothetical protein